ncbi:unnamed protein product [Lactuca saligna]|uniref:Uncharacterized protein n=1 Tax=Lactuca saligna TaxID=75948 RepID=A0AA35Z1W0_LACSI|nr:unnamed protein product [Lactuca saligna]
MSNGKGKIIEEEEEDMSEGAQLKRKKHDKYLDEIMQVNQAAKARERVAHDECFEKVEKAPILDYDVNHMIFSFYLKYDLPCLNPYDWVSLFSLLSKDEQKYEPILAHLKRMLVCYINDFGQMDVEIPIVFRKKPILKFETELKDLDKMKLERITNDNWSVAFQQKE